MRILCEDGLLEYDTDTGHLYWSVVRSNRIKIGVPIRQPLSHTNYVQVRIDNVCKLAHRIGWESVHGPIPDGFEINHINGKKDDNRLINLELVTHQQNMRHAKKTGLMPHLTRPERGLFGVHTKTGDGLFLKNSVVGKLLGFRNATDVARGRRRTCGGYRWYYKENLPSAFCY